MNFKQTYLKGKQGKSTGLPTGIKALTEVMRGIPRRAIIGVAAAPKVGKTTLSDFAFLLSPYLLCPDADIHWIYFSFEVERIKKEFKFAAYFFWHDFKIDTFKHKGKTYDISADYFMGKLVDPDSGEQIFVSEEHENMLRKIYLERIIPLFGEYDENGIQIKKGKIDFIEQKENPTGLRNYLISYAKRNGRFIEQDYKVLDAKGEEVKKKRVVGYKPNNPDSYLIVFTDHMRKVPPERGFSKKETIDKWLEYQVELRNWCGYTFVDIIHINRSMSDTDRLKYMKDCIYPNGDDIKDTGNLSEDCDYLITMFNPNDDKYNLTKHFGMQLVDDKTKKVLHPRYRSIHLVDSRDTECPKHIRVDMNGANNNFTPIKEPTK